MYDTCTNVIVPQGIKQQVQMNRFRLFVDIICLSVLRTLAFVEVSTEHQVSEKSDESSESVESKESSESHIEKHSANK